MWFFERMPRFNAELEGIAALEASEPWVQKADWRFDKKTLLLCIDVDLQVGDKARPVTVTYPATFPYAPPSITPRGATERWSSHQYGAGGELCLEHRADNWDSSVTGAEMLRSVYRLLASEGGALTEGQPIPVPSAHRVSLGQLMRTEVSRFVVTSSLIEHLEHLDKAKPATFRVLSNGKSIVSFLVKVIDAEAGDWTDMQLPEGIREYDSQKGFATSLKKGDPRIAEISSTVAAGARALRALLLEEATSEFQDGETIVLSCDRQVTAYRLYPATDAVYECGIILPDSEKRLPDSNIQLAAKKIGILGAGSMGSKVAVSLARAGVQKFLLMDDDVLSPENIIRHELTWENVGHHKVESLAERLKLIAPGIEVEVKRNNLGGQDSTRGLHALLDTLATCDLIVDATGNDDAFNYASSIAVEHSKPMAWARVFGGGYGGMIARSRPGIEPSPQQARAVIEKWCANPDFPSAPQTLKDYGALGASNKPMVADDADVSAIAAHFTRLLIDTLIAPEISDFDNSAYMIGLRKKWIFTAAFDTYPIDLGTPVSHTPEVPMTEEQNKIASAALIAMITAIGSEDS